MVVPPTTDAYVHVSTIPIYPYKYSGIELGLWPLARLVPLIYTSGYASQNHSLSDLPWFFGGWCHGFSG